MNVCVFMLFDIGWYMSKYNKLLCKKKMALWEEYERSWRMPTVAEFKELIDKCQWTWIGCGNIGLY